VNFERIAFEACIAPHIAGTSCSGVNVNRNSPVATDPFNITGDRGQRLDAAFAASFAVNQPHLIGENANFAPWRASTCPGQRGDAFWTTRRHA